MDAATKHDLSAQLRDELTPCSAFVVVGYKGMTVAEANELRGKFRESGCHFRVYKNSTVRFAITQTKHEPASSLLKGVTALAFHKDDPGAAARVARDFAKDHENFFVKGGIADGTVLDEQGVQRLASMPGPLELKAQFLALLNTPATSFVRVLNASAQSLLNVLNARKDKLEAA